MSSPPRSCLRLTASAAASRLSQGSQTILQTEAGPSTPSTTIRVRAEPSQSRHIQWAADVIDNEGMGKKSSKVCCIYHKPREAGDSDSDDSSSNSESDSDSEPDLSRAQRSGGRGRRVRRPGHGKGKDRKPSPNAYERQPKNKFKHEG